MDKLYYRTHFCLHLRLCLSCSYTILRPQNRIVRHQRIEKSTPILFRLIFQPSSFFTKALTVYPTLKGQGRLGRHPGSRSVARQALICAKLSHYSTPDSNLAFPLAQPFTAGAGRPGFFSHVHGAFPAAAAEPQSLLGPLSRRGIAVASHQAAQPHIGPLHFCLHPIDLLRQGTICFAQRLCVNSCLLWLTHYS